LFAFLKKIAIPVLLGCGLIGLHILFKKISLYDSINYLDYILHIFGGAIAAFFFQRCLHFALDKKWLTFPLASLTEALLIFGLVACLTISWEWFEYILDRATGSNWVCTVLDLLADQASGLLGAVLYIVLFVRPKFRK
jgi:hypothetical protein